MDKMMEHGFSNTVAYLGHYPSVQQERQSASQELLVIKRGIIVSYVVQLP